MNNFLIIFLGCLLGVVIYNLIKDIIKSIISARKIIKKQNINLSQISEKAKIDIGQAQDKMNKMYMQQILESRLNADNKKSEVDKESIERLISTGMTEDEAKIFLNIKK